MGGRRTLPTCPEGISSKHICVASSVLDGTHWLIQVGPASSLVARHCHRKLASKPGGGSFNNSVLEECPGEARQCPCGDRSSRTRSSFRPAPWASSGWFCLWKDGRTGYRRSARLG